MADKNKRSPLEEKMARLYFGDDDKNTDRLVIGLDFGTTYSGIAYVFTTKPDQIYTVTEW